MQIDWWTLGIQAINFLVLVWVLNRVLYRPVKAVIDRRQEMAEHALKQAQEAVRAADAEREKLVAKQAEFDAGREKALSEFHDSLQRERKEVLQKARDEAETIIAQARARASAEEDKVVGKLKHEIVDLATELAAKILSGEATLRRTSPDPAQVEAFLNKMSAEELGNLKDDVQDDGAHVVVVTAEPLSAEAQSEWQAMLARVIGAGAKPEFETDAAILGGVEVRFPHSELRLTWARYLQDARKALMEADGDA